MTSVDRKITPGHDDRSEVTIEQGQPNMLDVVICEGNASFA